MIFPNNARISEKTKTRIYHSSVKCQDQLKENACGWRRNPTVSLHGVPDFGKLPVISIVARSWRMPPRAPFQGIASGCCACDAVCRSCSFHHLLLVRSCQRVRVCGRDIHVIVTIKGRDLIIEFHRNDNRECRQPCQREFPSQCHARQSYPPTESSRGSYPFCSSSAATITSMHGLPKQKILNTFVYRNSSQIRKNGNGGKEASKTHLLEGRVIGWFGPVGVPFKPVIHFLIDASFTPSPLPQCYLKRLYKAFPNNKQKTEIN